VVSTLVFETTSYSIYREPGVSISIFPPGFRLKNPSLTSLVVRTPVRPHSYFCPSILGFSCGLFFFFFLDWRCGYRRRERERGKGRGLDLVARCSFDLAAEASERHVGNVGGYFIDWSVRSLSTVCYRRCSFVQCEHRIERSPRRSPMLAHSAPLYSDVCNLSYCSFTRMMSFLVWLVARSMPVRPIAAFYLGIPIFPLSQRTSTSVLAPHSKSTR
jgi:hypothetical protein